MSKCIWGLPWIQYILNFKAKRKRQRVASSTFPSVNGLHFFYISMQPHLGFMLSRKPLLEATLPLCVRVCFAPSILEYTTEREARKPRIDLFCFFRCYLHKKGCYITQLLALHCSCIMGDISEAPWTCETGVIQTCCRCAWEDQLFSVFALKSNHETQK